MLAIFNEEKIVNRSVGMMVLLSFLFFYIQTHSEGFGAGTIVKTPNGYVEIENISIGDQIIACGQYDNYVEDKVIYISKKIIARHLHIKIGTEDLLVACDHWLYDKITGSWIVAESLKNGDLLSGYPIVIELIQDPIDVYIIGTEKYHNFFVTTYDICVHNFVPIVLAISAAFGPGAIEIMSISAGIAALEVFFGYQWKMSKEKHDIVVSQSAFDIVQESDEIYILDDAQAPGMPTEKDGFYPPKKWDGKKVKNPRGPGYGWPDKDGNIWVPTGPKGHGGPHWDVQGPRGKRYRNVLPGGKER